MPLVEQELRTLTEHLSSSPVFSGVRVTRSLVFSVVLCRSLFWPLSCLTSELRIVITPLVCSNFSQSDHDLFWTASWFCPVVIWSNVYRGMLTIYLQETGFTARKHDHRRPFRRPAQLSLQTRYCCILIFPSSSTHFHSSYYIIVCVFQ